MKQTIKSLATEIRQLKSLRKTSPNGFVPGLAHAQYYFRHLHIAYSLMRGRTYEQIEAKTSLNNEPNWDLINEYKTLYISFKEAV